MKAVRRTRSCGQWGASRCTVYRLQYYIETLTDETTCCADFTGDNCDIPVCEPACESPAPCITQNGANICYCREGSTGASCELASCSASINCFPGTCINDTAQTCACSPGFGGQKCTKILTAGELRECKMKFALYDKTGLGRHECQDSTDDTIYSNAKGADYLYLDYTLAFQSSRIPPFPSYVNDLKLGLVVTDIEMMIVTPGGESSVENIACTPVIPENEDPPTQDFPRQTLFCEDVEIVLDKSFLIHQGNLSIVISTTSGGYKIFTGNDGNQKTKYYRGAVSSFHRSIKFDFEGPTHCSEANPLTEAGCPPALATYSDVTTSSKVQTEWFGWKDEDSGITEFNWSVYRMSTGSDGRLTEINIGEPLETGNLMQDNHTFDYSFDTAGMYSIILEVVDKAGNSYRARSLVLFDDSSNISTNENNELTVDDTVSIDGRLWFTDPSKDVMIHWEGRYTNQALYSNNWLEEVKPEDSLIDDTTGNRTISKIPNKKGIARFIVAQNVNDFDELADSPVDVQDSQNNLDEMYTLSGPTEDGKAARFFITAIDELGNKKVEIETVHFDFSGPAFSPEYTKTYVNEDSGDTALPYATRVDVSVQDRTSGIMMISYILYDVTGGQEIYSGSITGQSQAGNTKQSCESSNECYCLRYGPCYDLLQPVWIDHCRLTDHIGRTLRMDLTAVNGANLIMEYSHDIGVLENLNGIGVYQEPTAVFYQGDVPIVTITWVIVPSCYELRRILISISEDGILREVERVSEERRYVLKTVAGTDYAIVITAVYENEVRRDSDSLTFRTSGERPKSLTQGGDAEADLITKAGVLGGIAVGGAIFLALVILIIVMIVRKKQQKPVVPPVLRDRAVRLRNGVSSRISRMSQYFSRQSQPDEDEEDGERGAKRRSRRRRSFGFRLSKYDVQNDEKTHDGRRRDDKKREKDDDKSNRGRKKKGVSFETEENGEETKGPKSILKQVIEETSEKASPSVETAKPDSEPSTSHSMSADVKKYGKMVVPKDAPWLVADGTYSLGNAVSNTHSCFSDMRLSTLRNLGSTNVVAKTNRPGASYEDKMQMTALMNFMATESPKHDNIVGFLGAVPPTPNTAPVLFFEYCDEGSLLNWVKETRNVTDEVEDQMINFAIHIATGMDHMHLNGMLHRKLRACHILLKHSFANQMVAKISGFGPENDTVVKDDEGEDSTLRWCAPEQYDKPKLFTHKTDVWSYGILLHEMFNMGKEPYSGMSVTEMKESVKNGFKMGRPKYSPEFIYDCVIKECWQQNQSDRPDFAELTKVMTDYFEAGKGELDPTMIDLTESLPTA